MLSKGQRQTLANKLLPRSLAVSLGIRGDRKELESIGRLPADAGALRPASRLNTAEWFGADLGAEWRQVEESLASQFGTRSGAINPGDQRALYQLVRGLRPRSVLEVGSHVGASTSIQASALRRNNESAGNGFGISRMTTVDILDVNGPEGAWHRVECRSSPAQLLERLGVRELVTFVTSPSVRYLRDCQDKYDLIFLDGSHAAVDVYQEIPAALRLLNPDGLILLHDFFPELRPLWPDGAVIPGPELAVARLRSEGAPLTVLPLGSLPWPTKQGTNVTSLAILARAG